jgi:tetratricopeptide (TPR) repeat protein
MTMRRDLLVALVLASLALTPTAAAQLENAEAGSAMAAGFYELAERGLEHFAEERFAEALTAFEEALATSGGDRPERTTMEFNAAACEFALGRNAEAERRFLRVAEASPERSPLARLNAGYAALFAGRLDAASSHLEAAGDGAELEPRRAELASRLAAARAAKREPLAASPTQPVPAGAQPAVRSDPLFPAGPSALLLVSVGYDDNAAQSGTSDALESQGAGLRADSAFATIQGEFAWTARLSPRLAMQAYYGVDGSGLFAAAVRSLSYQSHELGLRTQFALSRRSVLRLLTAGSYALSGLDQPEPLVSELTLGLRLDVRSDPRFRTRIELSGRPILGLGGNDTLDGYRAEAVLAERMRFGALELVPLLGVRLLSAGEQRLALNADAYAACEPNCVEYRVPLSYAAPNAGLDFSYDVSSWLGLGASFRAEHRRYLDPSFIVGHPETEKRRKDLRFRARAGLEVSLDREGALRLTLDQTLIANSSNVAYDPASPEHENDPANRSFQQNLSEAGLLAIF